MCILCTDHKHAITIRIFEAQIAMMLRYDVLSVHTRFAKEIIISHLFSRIRTAIARKHFHDGQYLIPPPPTEDAVRFVKVTPKRGVAELTTNPSTRYMSPDTR